MRGHAVKPQDIVDLLAECQAGNAPLNEGLTVVVDESVLLEAEITSGRLNRLSGGIPTLATVAVVPQVIVTDELVQCDVADLVASEVNNSAVTDVCAVVLVGKYPP
jgi:hypothetical protein